jgi:hypothetical protein
MQRRNREINIFSLSAIDLFCSGMGAIMVLMVLLLPNQRKGGLDSQVSPALTQVEAAGRAIQVQDLDVVFVMDATMSMKDELNAVKTDLRSVIQVLRRISDDARVGFVAYTDDGVRWWCPLLPVNRGAEGESNLGRLEAVVAEVELIGNEDWPEDVLAGLEKAISFDWQSLGSDRRQMIVVIGDAPTHPANVEKSLTLVRQWVAESAKRSVSTVNTINPEVIPNYPGAELTIPYFKELVRQGSGRYLDTKGDLIGSILDLIIEK